MIRGNIVLSIALCMIMVTPAYALITPSPDPGIPPKEPKQCTAVDEVDWHIGDDEVDWNPGSDLPDWDPSNEDGYDLVIPNDNTFTDGPGQDQYD